MPSVAQRIKQTREKIGRIRAALTEIEYLCSGTLLERTKVCGRPGCRCAQDPLARHGPYYEWGHLKDGKLVHRVITPQQAAYCSRPSTTSAMSRSSCEPGRSRPSASSTPSGTGKPEPRPAREIHD